MGQDSWALAFTQVGAQFLLLVVCMAVWIFSFHDHGHWVPLIVALFLGGILRALIQKRFSA
jgi:hypothetical protein